MNLRDLQYIVAVADLKSFSKAAEQCHVSQPTLSSQIKKLEELLDMIIFERTNKKVMLTDSGRELIQSARRILREVETIHEIAHAARDPFSGRFRLGAFPTLATYVFPHIVQRVKEAFPALKLILVEEKTHELVEKLRRGELDAALLALPEPHDFLECMPLFKDEFMLAISSDHPLIDKREVTADLLADYPLLLLDEGHCLRDQALEVCQRYGGAEEQDMRATGLETLRQMVKAGTGITLMPKIAIQPNETGIHYIPFKAPAPQREIGLVWRKSTPRRILLDALKPLLTAK